MVLLKKQNKNPFEFTGERYVLEIPIKKVESKEYEIDDIGVSAEDLFAAKEKEIMTV